MSKKEPCAYFLRGTCRFGSHCKFSHQDSTGTQPLPEHRCNDPRTCKEKIREDMNSEKPKHWRLTCYAHWRHFPNDISGDMSFEELRSLAYDSARQGMSLPDIQKRERTMFQTKEDQFNALIKNPYKGPVTSVSSGFSFQSSGSVSPDYSLFGRLVPENSFASQVFNPSVSHGSGGFNSSGPVVPLQPSTPILNPFPPLQTTLTPTSPWSAPTPSPMLPTPFPSAPVTPSPSPFAPSPSPFAPSPSPFAPSPSPFTPSPFAPSPTPLASPLFQPGAFSLPSTQSSPAQSPSPLLPDLNTPATTGSDEKWQKMWELGEIPEEEPPVTVR